MFWVKVEVSIKGGSHIDGFGCKVSVWVAQLTASFRLAGTQWFNCNHSFVLWKKVKEVILQVEAYAEVKTLLRIGPQQLPGPKIISHHALNNVA